MRARSNATVVCPGTPYPRVLRSRRPAVARFSWLAMSRSRCTSCAIGRCAAGSRDTHVPSTRGGTAPDISRTCTYRSSRRCWPRTRAAVRVSRLRVSYLRRVPTERHLLGRSRCSSPCRRSSRLPPACDRAWSGAIGVGWFPIRSPERSGKHPLDELRLPDWTLRYALQSCPASRGAATWLRQSSQLTVDPTICGYRIRSNVIARASESRSAGADRVIAPIHVRAGYARNLQIRTVVVTSIRPAADLCVTWRRCPGPDSAVRRRLDDGRSSAASSDADVENALGPPRVQAALHI